jgi:hypothetical protein
MTCNTLQRGPCMFLAGCSSNPDPAVAEGAVWARCRNAGPGDVYIGRCNTGEAAQCSRNTLLLHGSRERERVRASLLCVLMLLAAVLVI